MSAFGKNSFPKFFLDYINMEKLRGDSVENKIASRSGRQGVSVKI
jgi:hypothetical protein